MTLIILLHFVWMEEYGGKGRGGKGSNFKFVWIQIGSTKGKGGRILVEICF